MAIKAQRVSGRPERVVVTACCTNKTVLSQVAARWTANALPSKWANVVIGWCVDHFRKYRRAPAAELGALFDEWKERAEPETAELVGRFLSELSADYAQAAEAVSPEFAVDTAARLMLRVQVVEAVNRAQLHLENGEVDRAGEEFQAFRPVQLGSKGWVDAADTETVSALIETARANKSQPLIEYDGALGFLLGGVMTRGGFVAFAGTEKGTKSWWLQDTARRAYQQGRSVAYFEAGDSTREEVLDRLSVCLSRRPWPRPDMPARIRVPTSISPFEGSSRKPPVVVFDAFKPKLLTPEYAAAALAGDGTGRLRICAHPSGTLTVPQIEAQLEEWRNDGFETDLVILDYADLLAPLNPRAEPRDQINANWRGLRSLSQKSGALVVTATQVKREAYSAWVIKREHMADDKRKLAEVTALIGINRTAREVDAQVWRLNLVVGRQVHLPDDQCVYTAGCLWIGSPGEVSSF